MTMYLEHFGLREAPFRITPHTEFFFAGANRGATLEALLYAITAGEGMVKVTGEVGSGKTMLCRVLMERLPETVETIYLAVPSLTRDEMLIAIASELKIETAGANTTQLLRALQERLIVLHAEGHQVVALIDEAHAMPLTTLEEVRLLSNLETGKEKLLQIVLFGQPELDEHLSLPNMRQLKERITHAFNLAPLPPREIHDYVNFRLRAAGYHGPDLFGPDVLRIIAEASEGLTRRINIYADKTLLAAFAAGTHSVSADHARAAVSDTQIVLTPRASPRREMLVGAAGLALGIAIGFGAAKLLPPAVQAPTVAVVPAVPAPATAVPVPADPATAPAAPAGTAPAPAASQLPAAPAPAGTASGAKNAGAPSAPAASAPPATTVAQQNRAVPAVDTSLAAGVEMLEGTGAGQWVVQLMMTDARERIYLESYLAEAGRARNAQEIYLFPTGSTDSPRVGVLLGMFATRDDANRAIAALPASVARFRPYARSVEAVRKELRRPKRS
jgi:type II secretory pathway predicted ATPase ExeA/septal ring-binding cell division protein DamX